MNANGPAGGNRPSHRSATLEGNRIMQSVPNTPDDNETNDHAALLARLGAEMEAALAAGRARLAAKAERLAAISFLEGDERDYAIDEFAAELYAPRTAGAR